MKQIGLTLIVFFFITAAHVAHVAHATTKPNPPKVLLVISSEGQECGKRPGFEMDEYALAYMVIRDNGVKVDIASAAAMRNAGLLVKARLLSV